MTTPYTYRVYCKSENKFYYGVRFAKNCHPSDLFVKYFTSSKGVKLLIEKYGINDFDIEIRKIFNNKESAILWERRVNKWTMKWTNYLNKHSNGNFLLTNDERKEIGLKSGNKCKELKLGFHKFTDEARIELCRDAQKKGNITSKKLGVGIYGMTTEDRRKNGNKCKENNLGFHSAEGCKKRTDAAKLPWWNNSKTDMKSAECPGPEWNAGRMTKGKLWWNNGEKSIMSIVAPDNTWNKGRLNWRK